MFSGDATYARSLYARVCIYSTYRRDPVTMSSSLNPNPSIKENVIIGIAAATIIAGLISHVAVHNKLKTKAEMVHSLWALTIGQRDIEKWSIRS
ncbi:hypothetical protein CS176_1026 [Corynebacterium glutamicum]|nr:hypothetical protein CS176_1026 [Corynebacterium glutamicum]